MTENNNSWNFQIIQFVKKVNPIYLLLRKSSMAIKVLVFHALVSLLLFKTSWAGEPIVEIGDVQPKVSAYTFDANSLSPPCNMMKRTDDESLEDGTESNSFLSRAGTRAKESFQAHEEQEGPQQLLPSTTRLCRRIELGIQSSRRD